MNDPIHPWLDADELRKLAESLMQGSGRPRKSTSEDAGFGESFVGFAVAAPPAAPTRVAAPAPAAVSPTPTPTPAPVPAAAPIAAVDAKPMPIAAAPPAPAAEPVTPSATAQAPPAAQPAPAPAKPAAPASSHELQCLQFQSDMHEQFGSGDLFILNRDGHTVFGKNNHPQFQFIARSMTKHAERRGLPKGHIHIKVGPAHILEIIPVELPNGGWVVGTVVPKALQPQEIAYWVREISKLGSTLNQL